MDHWIEAVLALLDDDVLAALPTGYGKKFNIWIDAIIDAEECTGIVLIPPTSIFYQHRAEVECFCSFWSIKQQDG